MGGAAGHLSHLWDDPSLTFAEIKDVIMTAASGKLERVSEKLDGVNIVFSYDVQSNALRVARSGGDIKRGGMDSAELAKKFFGRGNVEEIFNKSFVIIDKAIGSLPPATKLKVFGPNANRWFSMEIIYTASANTINYDSNSVVFHGWPIFTIDENGKVQHDDDGTGINELTSRIEQMQKAIGTRDWQVRGPSLVSMKNIADGAATKKAIAEVDAVMAQVGASDDDSVYDYLRALFAAEVDELGVSDDVAEMIVERCAETPGAPGIPDIKRVAPKEQHEAITLFIKSAEQMKKDAMFPLESAIADFAVEVLRGIDSTLIADSTAEVKRLRARLTKAISAIESSGNEVAMSVLQKEMARLKSVDNLSAPMEGIVFFYKGNPYKFTGAFAPAHQLLSLFTFGRKGVPKMDIGEARRWLREMLLMEGGHAFDDIKPIALNDFNAIWPKLKSDLELLGVTDVEPVGSTGKKQLMGDVDLAVAFEGGPSELFNAASTFFGSKNVTKVGGTVVSVRYENNRTAPFQVDLMYGKPSYLKWSRFGTSTIEGHKDASPVKGVARNVLLNAINRHAAAIVFPGKQTELDRIRYNVDFDKGLYKVIQTKRAKLPGKPPTKDWKTLDRELVTDDPDEIAKIMFGDKVTSDKLRRFEDVVAALKSSPKLKKIAPAILSEFTSELGDLVAKTPHMLGDDPDSVLAYVNKVVS